MSEEDFIALNPSNNNAVAISKGTLLVPLDKADAFRTNLEGYDKPLVTWTTVQAKKGESHRRAAPSATACPRTSSAPRTAR